MEVHGALVFASDEGIFASITSVGFRDGETVLLLDAHVVKPLLNCELDLNSILQPAALYFILIHLKLKGGSLFLHNLNKINNDSIDNM